MRIAEINDCVACSDFRAPSVLQAGVAPELSLIDVGLRQAGPTLPGGNGAVGRTIAARLQLEQAKGP